MGSAWHIYDTMLVMKSYDGENADITKDIIACAIEVHKTLGGPGILENFGRPKLVDGVERVAN